ncbi:MAG: type II toxin-antitoxin system VapC family toxin [Spirochaetaceae bacterium]|nr:type II toxin-antitoxin system VapC family toxin [Spirochaetaceae bacterium]RKX85162.1 MAG: type II toxin-antitoxin system VapC family toxin [Spirochaetota bacterium]RKX96869.1 MAG: type II toxin-antitoxin system VapC family toxin [Spirochaetota bacterium]
MNKGMLVDSDVLIDFLRGEEKAVSLFRRMQDSIVFSAISVAEIYAGTRGENEETEVNRLFSTFTVFPVTGEVARKAGEWIRKYRASHSMEIPDALIGATCLVNKLELVTLNTKHYPMFPGLKPPYTKLGMKHGS